jgi:hypothetical protein
LYSPPPHSPPPRSPSSLLHPAGGLPCNHVQP